MKPYDHYARVVEAVRHAEAFDEVLDPRDAAELFFNLSAHFIPYGHGTACLSSGEAEPLARRGTEELADRLRSRIVPDWIEFLSRELRPVLLPAEESEELCLVVPFPYGARLTGWAALLLEDLEISEWRLQIAAILGRSAGSAFGKIEHARALQRERDYARSIFDSIVSAMIVVGPDGKVRELNHAAAALFDIPITGCHYSEAFAFVSDDPVGRCLATGVAEHHVEARSASRGGARTWGFTVSPFSFEQGRGAVVGFRDLTETKRMEEILAASERQATIGRMAATVAHEVNNPLGAIKAQLRLLRARGDSPEKLEKRIDVVSRQVDRIARTIQALLGFSRQRGAELAVVTVEEVIRTVVDLFEESFREKKIAVDLELADGLPNVKGDVDEIQEVLVNLLENARDALSEGNSLKIAAHREGGRVCIAVEDDGPGLGENPERVFEPFFTTKVKGTGLGLTIARKICEAQGGSLVATNRSDAQGARFVATFGGKA